MKYLVDDFSDLDDSGSQALVLKHIKPGTTVLEFGSATGYMTKYMRDKLNCKVYGVEFEQQAAQIAAQYSERMLVADIEEYSWVKEYGSIQFDYILFADVLEHLRNPGKVLQQAANLLKPGGSIITSLPNIGHNAIIMELLLGNFEYQSLGLLDDSHIHFFTKKTMLKMFEQAGLRPIQLETTIRTPPQTEFKQDYACFPLEISKFLQERPDAHVYQYIAVAKRIQDLQAQPVNQERTIAADDTDRTIVDWQDSYIKKLNIVVDKVLLYIDQGEGFNEQDKIESRIKINEGIAEVYFDFSKYKHIQRLRFDPVTGYCCYCKFIEISTNIKNLKKQPFNAASVQGDEYIFIDTNPMVEFTGDFTDADYLELKYVFEILDAEEIARQDALKQQQINWLAEKCDVLRMELNNINNQLMAIQSSIGYKVLCKCNKAVNLVLPLGSTRRLFVKSMILGLVACKKNRKMLNWHKIYAGLKYIFTGQFETFALKIGDYANHKQDEQTELVRPSEYLTCLLKRSPSPRNTAEQPASVVVDIIIPIYNAFSFTEKCIETVLKNSDIPYNLYLIDDCSPDKRIKELLNKLANMNKPSPMVDLFIISNEQNLGFTASVNKGMSLAKNHVVLLNTDTEVPPQWLSRLVAPIQRDPTIASVTPFSNCATICSFPEFCQDNELLYGMNVQEIDGVFAAYGSPEPIEIPTGVGFCMLLNRKCLDQIGLFDQDTFGKGYGEENDWCMRAYKAAYKNTMITNLFVYHKHGASFSGDKNKSKEQRSQENSLKLHAKHPEYQSLVEQFVAEDRAQEIRQVLTSAVTARQNKKGILFVSHALGGGTQKYQEKLISGVENAYRIYRLEYIPERQSFKLIDDNCQKPLNYYLEFAQMDQLAFKRLTELLQIDLIYINQLVTYPVYPCMKWITLSEVPYEVFIHDFFFACPSYNLLNSQEHYCRGETDEAICQPCLDKKIALSPWLNLQNVDINEWRERAGEFLTQARRVMAPSKTAAQIISKYYPDIEIIVQEHQPITNTEITFDRQFCTDTVLNVACIGNIFATKGSKILYEIKKIIENEGLPINLTVIGITDVCQEPFISSDGRFQITGSYNSNDISALLAQYKITVVMVLSICPETYSYTTSEAICSGYPVLAFPIGAPAERIETYQCGWVVEEISAHAVVKQLKSLLQNRNEILEKAQQCQVAAAQIAAQNYEGMKV